LLKQLLTEGLILTALAAAGGILMANWWRNLIVLLFPSYPGVMVNLPAEIDWRVLALSAGVCLISTLLVGLIPALQASKVDLAGAMKSESGTVVGGRGRTYVRSGLVLVQVSLSFVLLVGAGLMLKSLQGMRDADLGFSADRVLTTYVDLVGAGYDTARGKTFQNELIDRLQALAGVESATLSRVTPFSYRSYPSAPIAVDGYDTRPGETPTVEYNDVGERYLETMGIPVVSGRDFTRADDETAQPVAIVNDVMASQYWRGENPVGGRLQVKGRWLQVVGVAKVSKYQTLRETPKPFFYLPVRQAGSFVQAIEIRTTLAPETLAKALSREVRALDANLGPGEVITLRERVNRMSWTQRAAVILLAIFCGMALLLAGIGLYGVMSYAVSQSTRELGLRMALGAHASDLLRLVMSHGLALTASGVLLGAGAALVLTRLLGDLLYKVSPRDPVAFALAFAVMLIASLPACVLPAWRAIRIDPSQALRN
jgi:predicted permease